MQRVQGILTVLRRSCIGRSSRISVAHFSKVLHLQRNVDQKKKQGVCQICGGQHKLTEHHLIPQKVHPDYHDQAIPDDLLQEILDAGYQPQSEEPKWTKELLMTWAAALCWPCHLHVHQTVGHDELAKKYNTISKMLQDPKLAKRV